MADDEARRLTADADRRLAALARSVLNGAKKGKKKTSRRKRGEKGGVYYHLVFVVGGVGLFLWGFTHGNTVPDGRWLLAMLVSGAGLACLVAFGRSYRRTEDRGAARTAKLEGRVQQHQGSEHFLDGA